MSALIPYKADQGRRDYLWSLVQQRYQVLLPQIELCLGIDNSEPFCRSRAVNNAAKLATGDVFLIVDSDIIFEPSLIDQISAVIWENAWIIPFSNGYRLTELASELLINQGLPASFSIDTNHDIVGNDTFPGCMFSALTRRNFEEVGGMDEHFEGWGYEDVSFGLALDTLCGPYLRLNDNIYHLWHPQDPRAINSDLCQYNSERYHYYQNAVGNPELMRALINANY